MKVLVTSTTPDELNTNSRIRLFVFEAFERLLGQEQVKACPLELSEAIISRFRPDLILALGSLVPDQSPFRRLRRAADAVGSQLGFWLLEDPYEFDYAFKAELTADVIFSNDRWAAEHYRHDRVHHLPLAASPKHHFRTLKPIPERSLKVFFCGVAYPSRVALLRRADTLLSRHAVSILGSGWPTDLRCAYNRRLSAAEMADHAQDACLTLNLGRDLAIANQRYQLPQATPGPRTFEIALSGSAQLYFITSLEICDYFTLGSDIIPVDSLADISRAIERASDAPQEIYAIAKRAQECALAAHTYVNRAQSILDACRPGAARTSVLT